MAVYVIGEIKVSDDKWIADYAAKVHDIIHRHGGRYLARSANIVTIEGDAGDEDLVVLIEFPSLEAVSAFGSDPEYAPFGDARRAGSISHFRIIDDTDAAGTIPYLGKG